MVDTVNNNGNVLGTGFGSVGSNGVMGKDDFLNLMIAQLKNQDPLSPLDSSDFAAQLAQFSSLEQLANLNETVRQSVDANFLLIQSVNNTMTANLIGKNAKIAGGDIEYQGQTSVQFGFNLPASAKDVKVEILDENGEVVKTIENLPGEAGDHKLSWDFTDNNGETVKKGKYSVKVTALDAIDGSSLNVGVFTIGKIEGIKFTDSGTKLLINGIEYDLGKIMEIIESTTGINDGRTPKWQQLMG